MNVLRLLKADRIMATGRQIANITKNSVILKVNKKKHTKQTNKTKQKRRIKAFALPNTMKLLIDQCFVTSFEFLFWQITPKNVF